jgi:triosephosphate isomerase
MRQPIIAGNWKMNGTRPEAEALVKDLLPRLAGNTKAQVVLCPPFTALATVGPMLEGTGVALGAQDLFWKEKGAYTGQISAPMLVDAGCRYVIVGHSEPRGRFGVLEPDFDAEILAYFGDSNESVCRKLRAALAAGLTPICCVGETLQERQQGDTDAVISGQIQIALRDVTAEQAAGLILAYEPVWAIGTGQVCAADEADRVCGIARAAVGRLCGAHAADAVRVQYGGSVKPDNAAELLSMPNIDGALVGGASLKAADFAAIVAAA